MKISKDFDVFILGKAINKTRSSGEVIVLCHGVFDILHPGHISHLHQAKSLGDILVVTVTDDNFVNKGPGRPIQKAVARAEILKSLKMVDHVAISKFPTAIEAINIIKPDIYVKGPDYSEAGSDITGNIQNEKLEVEKFGGKIFFTSSPTESSSTIINAAGLGISNSTQSYLNKIRKKYSQSDVRRTIREFKKLRILIVGETIIDEYLTCEALGKSSKDPVLVFREGVLERQLGGALAVANHCANLGARVTVLSKKGRAKSDSNLIKSGLNTDITPIFIESKKAPTIVKRRYVDSLTQFRVFETYTMSNELDVEEDIEQQIRKYEKICDDYDLVIICDYGHGFMAPKFIDTVVSSSARLSINTQSNAGNRGINSISKYARFDFLSLNGSEIGLEIKSNQLKMEQILPGLLIKTGAKRILVTEGAKGLSIAEKDCFSRSPALADKVVDRVGAGDAVFATASLLFALDKDPEITGFLSNLAGGITISDLGNRKSVDSMLLTKFAMSLLK